MRYRQFLVGVLVAVLVAGGAAAAQQRIYGTSSTGTAVPILVDATGAVQITFLLVSVIFEGDTADDYETTLAVVDPTADRTITLPDADVAAADILKIVGITNGTAAAGKALVADANVDVGAGLRNIVGSGDSKFATYHVGATAGCDGTPATAAKGIVTSCTSPEASPDALLERIQQLEAQVAALLAAQRQ